MDSNEGNNETSQFNEAQLQIMRLNDFWIRAEFYANKGLLIKWKFILDTIYRELYPDVLRSSDKKELMKKNQELIRNIAKSKNKSELYNSLDERHRFLKELQDSCGKGSIYRDADGEDFD